VKHLSGAPHLGRFLALPTSIKLGRKYQPGTNTLAFYKKLQITTLIFITLIQIDSGGTGVIDFPEFLAYIAKKQKETAEDPVIMNHFQQGSLTEGDGSVQLTSLY
jgi:hypothetical protein